MSSSILSELQGKARGLFEKSHIPSARLIYSKRDAELNYQVYRVNESLLGTLVWSIEHELPPDNVVVYCHGFPDQAVDHRGDRMFLGNLCSRMPQKLAQTLAVPNHSALFAFNFSGT